MGEALSFPMILFPAFAVDPLQQHLTQVPSSKKVISQRLPPGSACDRIACCSRSGPASDVCCILTILLRKNLSGR